MGTVFAKVLFGVSADGADRACVPGLACAAGVGYARTRVRVPARASL